MVICTTCQRRIAAFSLVEVVVALGIFVFAGFALISVLSVGIQSNRDSKEQLQAANIIEFICSTRRAVPTTDISSAGTGAQPNFPLPVLFSSSWTSTTTGFTTNNFASPTYLTWDGASTNQANAIFGLLFNITAPTSYATKTNPGFSTVYLCVYWPAQAPLTGASGHVEVTSTFALP